MLFAEGACLFLRGDLKAGEDVDKLPLGRHHWAALKSLQHRDHEPCANPTQLDREQPSDSTSIAVSDGWSVK